MKAKVLKTFIDGQKNVIHQAGDIIELTAERFEEITAVEGDPLVEKVETKTRKSAKEDDE